MRNERALGNFTELICVAEGFLTFSWQSVKQLAYNFRKLHIFIFNVFIKVISNTNKKLNNY
jgi:hypothetical protein